MVVLTFLPSLLFADNYIDEFPVYVYGDIRPIAAIFNSIAMLTNEDIYGTLISIAVFYSVITTGLRIITTGDLLAALKSTSFVIGALAVMLVPVDVHLVDKRMDKGLLSSNYFDNAIGYEKISNVPWLTAMSPSIATTISSDLIELIDDGFKGNTVNYDGSQDIGKISFSDIGFSSGFEFITKILDNYSFDSIGTTASANLERDLKKYIESCVIPRTVSDPLVKTKLVAPSQDVFSAIAPAEIGVDDTYDVEGETVGCSTFYTDNIKDVLSALVPDIESKISEIVGVPDITALTGLSKIALSDIQSTVFAQTTEQLAMFAENAAVAPLIEAVVDDFYRGTGISGQSIANNITGAKSTARIQAEGLGQFKWTAEILPYALHFMFGIILAASILTMVMAVARGLTEGTAIAKNYFGGFIQFEMIRVSLSLVNNLVLYYAVVGAADKLTAFNGNPFAVTRIPEYLNYIATMEGISGILGISAIFIIPAIILKGDVTSAATSLQGISGRYAGNDLQTAREAVSKSSARQKAVGNVMNDEAAMKKLNAMGTGLPPGKTPFEYYSQLTQDLSSMSSGIGSTISQNNMNDYSKGAMKEQVSNVSKTAGFGSSANTSSVETVGFQDGARMGHTTNETDSMRSTSGWDAKRVARGDSLSSLKKDLTSMSYGDNANVGSVANVAKGDGEVMASTDNHTSEFRNNTNWNSNKVGRGNALNNMAKDASSMGTSDGVSDSELNQYSKGNANQGRINANKMLGIGRKDLTKEEMTAIQYGAESGVDSEIGKGIAAKKNYEKYSKTNPYQDSSELGELSNIAKTMAKIKAQSGIEQAATYDEKDSAIKAKQQMGNIKGMENATNSQYVKDFVEKALEMISKGPDGKSRSAAAIKEWKKSGLIDEHGKVDPKKWIEAKAFASANNMSASNALSVAGMTISGALGENPTVQVSAVDSVSTGRKEDFYNNQKQLHNTDPLTTLAMERFGGNVKKAANYARSADGAKWMMDPRNEASLVAAEVGYQLSPKDGDGESQTMSTMAIAGATVAAHALNKFTQKDVKADLTNAKSVFTDGKLQGYENDKGVKIADKDGFKVDSSGKRVKSGAIVRGAKATWNGFSDLRNSFSSDESTNSSNNDNSNKNNSNSEVGSNKDISNKHNNSFEKDISNSNINNNEMHNNNQKVKNWVTEPEIKASGGWKGTAFKTMGGLLLGAAAANASETIGNILEFAGGAAALVNPTSAGDTTGLQAHFDRNDNQVAPQRFSPAPNKSWYSKGLVDLVSGAFSGNSLSTPTVPTTQQMQSYQNLSTSGSGIFSQTAANAIHGNGGGINFAELLRQGDVRQEFAQMNQEQKISGMTSGINTSGNDMMTQQLNEVSNAVNRNSGGVPEFSKKDLDELKDDLKRFRRNSSRR